MALINHRTREIHFKIVYYGPGLCGKTTNLKSLHDKLPAERRGKLISIATDHERTLFFDFLPIDLGQVNGFLTRFHLYTVPGQVYYRLSRRAVLQGVDGLIFVADSHPSREYANRDSLADLNDHLRTLGITGPALVRIPWVFQYNKRDVEQALPVERLRAALNPNGWQDFEAVASDGRGVSETLRAMCKAVLSRLATGTFAPQMTPEQAANAPPPPAPLPSMPALAAAMTSAASAPAEPAMAPTDTPFVLAPRVSAPTRIDPAPAPVPAAARPRVSTPRPTPTRAPAPPRRVIPSAGAPRISAAPTRGVAPRANTAPARPTSPGPFTPRVTRPGEPRK